MANCPHNRGCKVAKGVGGDQTTRRSPKGKLTTNLQFWCWTDGRFIFGKMEEPAHDAFLQRVLRVVGVGAASHPLQTVLAKTGGPPKGTGFPKLPKSAATFCHVLPAVKRQLFAAVGGMHGTARCGIEFVGVGDLLSYLVFSTFAFSSCDRALTVIPLVINHIQPIRPFQIPSEPDSRRRHPGLPLQQCPEHEQSRGPNERSRSSRLRIPPHVILFFQLLPLHMKPKSAAPARNCPAPPRVGLQTPAPPETTRGTPWNQWARKLVS